MPESDRLSNAIEWIDLSFVERRRTPRWAIEVGIRCHLAGISLRDTSQFLGELEVQRSHVAIHQWLHKASWQPVARLTGEELVIDETMIKLHGQQHWLYAAIDPETNKFIHVRLATVTNKQVTRWFLAELHQYCNLDDVTILTDAADYLVSVLAEDGYRFQVGREGNRQAIERVFREVKRRTSSFANSFSHVAFETAQEWLKAFAVRHNTRQT